MSIEPASPVRRRRTADQTREEALGAAQALLISRGPESVTLMAVAQAVGTSHANLIHHFGSAAGLQSALMARIIAQLGETLRGATAAWRETGGPPTTLIEPTFRAFGAGGAARLAVQVAASNDLAGLAAVAAAIKDLTTALTEAVGGDAGDQVADAVLLTTLLAFGDALIGTALKAMLGVPDDRPRRLAEATVEGWAAVGAQSAGGHGSAPEPG